MRKRLQRQAALAGGLLALVAVACTNPSGTANPSPASTSSTAIPTVLPSATPLSPAAPTLTPLPVALCPGPGSATLPSTPPNFADYAATIGDYLSGGGSPDELLTTLAAWGSIDDAAGAVMANYDYTGDGAPEVLVVVQAPREQFPDAFMLPGDVYIYGCSEGTYTILYADYSTSDRPTPQLVSANLDLNGNGLTDVLYTTTYCGAHTCTPHVTLIEWDPASAVFRNLSTNISDVASSETSVVDTNGDGIYEIEVNGGFVGSVGAGPQRASLYRYAWDGSTYVLDSRQYTTPESEWYPIHYLNDGDALLQAGDADGAITRYQRVLGNPNPQTWSVMTPEGELISSADEIRALQAYARYRMMLAYIISGDRASAQAMYDNLIAGYAPEVNGAQFATMATLFWDNYTATGSVSSACTAVTDSTTQNPNTFWILNQYGYENHNYQPAELCVMGG